MQPSMKNDVSDRYLAIFAQYCADIDASESTSDRLESHWWRLLMVFTRLLCGVYSEFVQQRISDASMTILFTAVHSMVGISFVQSIVQLSLLLTTFEMIFLLLLLSFLGGVATYDPIICQVCHTIKSLLQQQNAIPRKHHLFIALGIVTHANDISWYCVLLW